MINSCRQDLREAAKSSPMQQREAAWSWHCLVHRQLKASKVSFSA